MKSEGTFLSQLEPSGVWHRIELLRTTDWAVPPRETKNVHKNVPLDPVSKTLHTPLHLPIRATCPAYLFLLDLITRTKLGEKYRSLSSSLCNFLHYCLTSSLVDPNILLSTLFSNTLSLHSSLKSKLLNQLKSTNMTELRRPYQLTELSVHTD